LSELTARQQQENQTTQQLGQMTTQLEEQLAQQKQLAQQQQSKTLEKAFSTLREENEQNKETISDLQEQIAQAQTQNQDGNRKNVEALQQQLEAVQQRNQVVHAQGREYKTMIERLHEEIAESERKQRETEQLVTFLRTQVEEAERREQDADRKRQEMEKTVAELNQEKEGDKQDLHLLEERIEELRQKEALEDSLNDFERSVLACLQNSLKFQTERWRVHDQFDVSEKKRSRRVTDFIVVSQSCIFIIEAKYYLGRISAEGDAKNTPWICQPTTGSNKLVKSSGGNNPYKQVLNYTDSMRRRVDWNKSTGKVGIYGIVVFPEGADVSRLRSEIGGSHYEITTLERLVDLIQNIEREIVSYNPDQVSLLSVEQLDNLICGRPVKKQLSSS